MSVESIADQRSTPIFLMTQVPPECLKVVVAQNKDNFLTSTPDLISSQEKRWFQRTGVRPEDSKFSIIVPVHNEERSLPSFLGSLRLADIPFSCPVNFIFITNGCTDKSSLIIDNFVKEFKDSKNLSLKHVDTEVLGKANALRIGNALALRAGHRIAISIDANNFMEPNCLALLYGAAYQEICSKKGRVVLLSPAAKGVRRPSKQNFLFNLGRNPKQDAGGFYVNGWMMAWNTSWMEKIGGPPPVAVEDYAMGVMARYGNFETRRVTEAAIWGYIPNNLADILNARFRYVRGMKTLMNLFPETETIIRRDYFFMRKTFHERATAFLQEIEGITPVSLLRKALNFCFWEYALWQGNRQYHTNPFNQSWEQILSTK